jgi:hypothetical protein
MCKLQNTQSYYEIGVVYKEMLLEQRKILHHSFFLEVIFLLASMINLALSPLAWGNKDIVISYLSGTLSGLLKCAGTGFRC